MKYSAKLRLLEYGLLEAAHKVDEFTRKVSNTEKMPKQGKKGKGKAGAEEEDEDVEMVAITADGEDDEREDAFFERVNLFAVVTIARAIMEGAKKGSYKNGLVYQYRKDLINEFLKATILPKCQRCRT